MINANPSAARTHFTQSPRFRSAIKTFDLMVEKLVVFCFGAGLSLGAIYTLYALIQNHVYRG